VDDSRSVQELTADIQKHTHWGRRRVRGLRPWAEDKERFTAVNQGDFLINGFRNGDLQRLLYHAAAQSPVERRRRSAAISRKLRLLRSHGLIQKPAAPYRLRYSASHTSLSRHRSRTGHSPGCTYLSQNQCPSTQSDCEGGMKIVAPRKQTKI